MFNRAITAAAVLLLLKRNRYGAKRPRSVEQRDGQLADIRGEHFAISSESHDRAGRR